MCAGEPFTPGWAGRQAQLTGVPSGARDLRIVLHGGLLLRIDLELADGTPARVGYVSVKIRGEGEEHASLSVWLHKKPSTRYSLKNPGPRVVTIESDGYETVTTAVTILPEREARLLVRLVPKEK